MRPLEDRPDPSVTVQDLTLEVVGIFQSGFVFGDNQVFAPLDVVQQAYAQEGRISHMFVAAASVIKVPQVERGLRQAFGDADDVISGQSTARVFAETLGSIEYNSRRGALAAIVVAAVVVLFTMALVTRERTRKIGVLKAIGASDGDVAAQFAAESLALAAIGGLVGLILFAVAGSALGSIILQLSGNSSCNDIAPFPVILNTLGAVQPRAFHAVFTDTGGEFEFTLAYVEQLQRWAAVHHFKERPSIASATGVPLTRRELSPIMLPDWGGVEYPSIPFEL